MEKQSNRRRGQNQRARFGMILLNTFLMLLAIGMTLAVGMGFLLTWYFHRNVTPNFDEETSMLSTVAGPSQIYYYEFEDRVARTGEKYELPGGTLDGGVHSIPVSYAECPQALVDAFVAIEDQQFFLHHGVNWVRTLSAVANYCLGYTRHFGASTITQQLVKNLSGKNEYSVERKLQEMCWANDLENRCTKEQIMERYLNVINLSQGCYGVGAAAARYFGKSVGELNVSECAALAGITNNPSYYDPVRFPEHTKARRDLILSQMRALGYLEEEMYQAAIAQPLVICENAANKQSPTYSWYVDMVLEDVIADLCAEYDYTREYASRLVFCGGLAIESAVDPKIQNIVEEYYRDTSHFPLHKNGERGESGMIILHPLTGDILAVAGGVGEKMGNRLQHRATGTLRPAASAIKPLSVYAPALEHGDITWASVFDDVPITYDQYGRHAWPKNATRIYRGLTDIRYAVSHSVNTVAVRVLERVGLEESFRFLKNTLGMNSLVEWRQLKDGRTITDMGEAALGLGQMNYGVTLRELTAGYTPFCTGGMYMKPHSYYRVTAPDGRVLLSHDVEGNYALSEQNACIMTKLLEQVVTRGTGRGAKLCGGRVAVAGKTGTSSADCDCYFIGYTPEYLAGVWYGFDYPTPMSDLKNNPAVGIWKNVMEQIVSPSLKAGKAKTNFDLAPGIVKASYCCDSGLRPTDACRADARGDRLAEGYFIQGTEPRSYCDRHLLCDVEVPQTESPDETMVPKTLRRVGKLRYRRRLPGRIYVADQSYLISS